MKEQLISFKTAKLAKKKEFNCTSDYAFGTFDGAYVRKTLKCKHSMHPSRWKNDTEKILAPTQSLLQKWLREVHDIDMWIYNKDDRFYYQCPKVDDVHPNLNHWADTYEEALEKSLFAALELI
jgi:branched-subunit amino acid aminotransferase/4-amino-4-deoxychorismate lyase